MGNLIEWKRPELEGELKLADPRLFAVVMFAAAYSLERFGKKLLVTRVESHRGEVEGIYGANAKPSVHEMHPCRGCDARSHDYTDEENRRLVTAVNTVFEYHPPRRLMVALHETVDVMARLGNLNAIPENEHLHFQVPPASDPKTISRVRLWA